MYLQVSSLNSTMTIMFMTIDRFIAVCFPFKAKQICTPRKAKITVASILFFTLIYTVPQYLYARVVGKNTCVALVIHSKLSTIVSWTGVVLNSFLPFSIILTLNGFIIHTFKQRSAFFERNATDKASASDENKVIFLCLYLHKVKYGLKDYCGCST